MCVCVCVCVVFHEEGESDTIQAQTSEACQCSYISIRFSAMRRGFGVKPLLLFVSLALMHRSVAFRNKVSFPLLFYFSRALKLLKVS